MAKGAGRFGSSAALVVTAVVTGALVGVLTAAFIWTYEEGLDLVWTELPDQFDVDPFESWWLPAVLLTGGLLVGLCQRFVGDLPIPIDDAIDRWRTGGRIEASTVPGSALNSAVVLVLGGPVGFEAALTGIIGGGASWVSDRVGPVGRRVRQAWGAARVEGLPDGLQDVPYWLAALAGLFTYRWLPFGHLDLGFRFSPEHGELGITDVAVVVGFAALVTPLVVWAVVAIKGAEGLVARRRSPVGFALGGAVAFTLLALVDHLVLFSGQEGIQQLPGTAVLTLLYLTLAKWLALCIALGTGWRGGPVFPMFFSVAAFGATVDGLVDVDPHLVMIAGIAAVSTVFLKGRIVLAFVLTLYAVPLTFGIVILLGCAGAAAAMTLGRSAGILPAPPEPAPGTAAGT